MKKEPEPAPKAKPVKKEPKAKKEEPKDEPMDETDFSKAVKALATADAGKKKAPKQRKVDMAHNAPGVSVVDDWDCMLNQTNIGHNNNKFYIVQLQQQQVGYSSLSPMQ